MDFVSKLLVDFRSGILAFVDGIHGATMSEKVRSSYFWFSVQCLVITILGYSLVSMTMFALLFLPLLVILGPVFGPLAFGFFSTVALMLLFVLWVFGKFPWALFVGSFGILRPLISVPHLAFSLTLLLLPMSCDTLMLAGVERIFHKNSNGHKISPDQQNPIERSFKRPGLRQTLNLVVCNLTFNICLKLLIRIVLLKKVGSWVDYACSSFLLGSQLASVYTIRIRRLSFKFHVKWCFENIMRVIGFTLPFCLLQDRSWLASFLYLGVTYFSAASLVQGLVEEDIKQLS
jgi:hypothetical protein